MLLRWCDQHGIPVHSLYLQSYNLDLTISNMNQLKFSPKKDYTANRLTSGVLQLSDHTHLVLNETAMQPGQLDANGMLLFGWGC